MNRTEKKLKEIVTSAVYEAGASMRWYREEYDLDHFYDAVLHDTDDSRGIAVKALVHLCANEENKFNRNAIALKSVLRFLAETTTHAPQEDQDVKACLTDLRERPFTAEGIGAWLDQWYRFTTL